MSFTVRKGVFSPLELQYEKLKKQSYLENEQNKAGVPAKERQSGGLSDRVTLTSTQPANHDPGKLKPSQPVTQDEMQALRAQFSVYV